jgi:small-conductance mechanosensitive channel
MRFIELVGPNQAVQVFGVRLVGINATNGSKLLLTLGLILFLAVLTWLLKGLANLVISEKNERYRFWTRQGINVFTAALLILGTASIWFDDPTRLTTALGLVTAGLAFALQRVVTAIAGYFVILRGDTFSVGDRIVMGGVRGDVIALSFTQTTIMEMGQPPAVQEAPPAMWVRARQYTGRVVTVSNARIFDEPVYNYTRDFPFVFEEMTLPIAFSDNRREAERILLDVARRHTVDVRELSEEALAEMRRRYFMEKVTTEPRVYWRITDNWIELTVRFVAREHGVRDVKDKMSREIMDALDAAGIGVASATYAITGLPPLHLELPPSRAAENGNEPATPPKQGEPSRVPEYAGNRE